MEMHARTAAAVAEIAALRAKVVARKTERGVHVDARRDDWHDIADHADQLSPAARPLARVLRQREIIAGIDAYKSASDAAKDAQTTYRGIGARAAWLGLIATIASAALLLLQWQTTTWQGWSLNLVHFVCLGAALLSAGLLWLRSPSSDWARARARSENTRVEHFSAILDAAAGPGDAPPGELPAKVLALEYIRVYLIEDQRDWHAKRGNDFYWSALGHRLLRLTGIVLLVAAMTPVVCDLVLASSTWSPAAAAWAGVAKTWVGPQLAGLLGVIGGALQTLSTSLASLSMSTRNRRSYARMTQMLTHYLGTPLTAARDAAVRGDDRALDRYWWAVRTELVAENRAWSEALGMSSAYLIDEVPASTKAR
jgi:hypothetical protein